MTGASSLPELLVFVVLGGAAIGFALFTITRRNPVTAVMSLVATFFALAGIYATLSAHFLAILQILVYAGAIMVLFIFVVMILNREEVSPVSFRGIITRVVGVLAGGYVAYVGAWIVWRDRGTPLLAGPSKALPPEYGTVSSVGRSLFTEFVFPFEAISLLLLVAIVGGVIVSRSARQEEMAEERARHVREIQSRARNEATDLPAAGAVAKPTGHAVHH